MDLPAADPEILPYIIESKGASMLDQTQRELLETVEAEDVRFIRLSYADLFGQPRNMAIMSSGLKNALLEGVPTDASKIAGFEDGSDEDLFLVPDSSTASLLPWRPAHDRVMRLLCDIRTHDGAESVYSTRNLLRSTVEEAVDLGYIINAGADCEFTLFRMDEQGHGALVVAAPDAGLHVDALLGGALEAGVALAEDDDGHVGCLDADGGPCGGDVGPAGDAPLLGRVFAGRAQAGCGESQQKDENLFHGRSSSPAVRVNGKERIAGRGHRICSLLTPCPQQPPGWRRSLEARSVSKRCQARCFRASCWKVQNVQSNDMLN